MVMTNFYCALTALIGYIDQFVDAQECVSLSFATPLVCTLPQNNICIIINFHLFIVVFLQVHQCGR